MYRAIRSQLRHETRLILPLMLRDLAKRLAALMLIAAICLAAGATNGLPLIVAGCLITELVLLVLVRGQSTQDVSAPQRHAVLIWLICWASTVGYLSPTILLADQPSVPILLIGFTWTFGVLVHMANTFGHLPLFNLVQLVPAMALTAIMLVTAWSSGHFAGDTTAWIIALVILLIYCVNTVQTTLQRRVALRSLARMRSATDDRLRALEVVAQRDTLTGLMNRQAFDAALAELLHRSEAGRHVGVFLIDLDGFKPINDSHGHPAGDALLIALARRLEQLPGPGGVTARIGGDEFALAVPCLRGGPDAMALAQAAVRVIGLPVQWADKPLTVMASVGVALSGIAGNSVTDLCAAADQAMYRCKGSPLRTMMYLPGAFPRRLTQADRHHLIDAMSSGAIRPHYQPKVSLSDGRLIGVEALARWQTAPDQLALPDDFLPDIRQLGLQDDFNRAILAQTLSDIDSLLAAGLDPGQVSVNMNQASLATRSGLADLRAILARHPRATACLTLELSEEGLLSRSADMVRQALAELRGLGLRVSLDDFGSGDVSIQHLRHLPLDEIKIAPNLIADLAHDPRTAVLTRGLIDIARGLDLRVVAEGIETEGLRDQVMALGAQFGQGFLFGAALPMHDIKALIQSNQRRPAPDDFVPGLPPLRQAGSGRAR
jgi:diguanylate cyclase